jgi:hypothetical protein
MSKTVIDCAFCGFDITLLSNEINLAICQHCKYANKIIDSVAIKHQNISINETIRLSNHIENLKLELNQTQKTVVGIHELEYNESALFLFFTLEPQIKAYSFFDYNWYEVTEVEKIITNVNIDKIEFGENCDIFYLEKSYIINKEKGNAAASSGQVRLPLAKNTLTVLEHSINNEIYFSFWDNNLHLKNYLFTLIENVSLNKDVIFRTIEHECTSCRKILLIKNYPYVKSFACVCGATFSTGDFGSVKFEKKFSKYQVPYIKLNSKCIFNNIEFEVIGHVKKEDTYGYYWDEFIIWNKEEGFFYLSVYNGNWIKLSIEKLKAKINTKRNSLQQFVYADGKEYAIFNDYKSSILNCSGSFVGNILNDKEYSGVEYISPPNMWAFEKPLNETITAFRGEHIDGKQLLEAFNNNIVLPKKRELGAIEPKKGSVSINFMMTNFIVGFLLILCTQIFTSFFNKNRIVYEGGTSITSFDSMDINKSKLVTTTFDISNAHSNLSIKLEASINNAWLENEIELINLNTGETINTEQGVEYYSGVDNGYSWSEGKRENELILSYLPKGTYQASFTPTWETPNNYYITIIEDVTTYKNFWLIVLFLTIPCTLFFIYNYNIEVKRWSSSNYNPYGQ